MPNTPWQYPAYAHSLLRSPTSTGGATARVDDDGAYHLDVGTTTDALKIAAGGTVTVAAGVTAAGGLRAASPTVSLGYSAGSGAGGSVTQASNKSTGVTLNTPSGAITMNAANLAATTTVGFTVTNSVVVASDVVLVSIRSGATADSYTVTVDAVAAGSFRISLRNYTGGGLAEAVIINYAIIHAVNT